MLTKTAVFLLFAGACLAFPATEQDTIPKEVSSHPIPHDASNHPIVTPLHPHPLTQPQIAEPHDEVPVGGPIRPGTEGGKPEDSDLKTANSLWYSHAYYPVHYSRSYHAYPRSYASYSYYPTSYYSYYSPYSYWW